jgi:hypothetical protein
MAKSNRSTAVAWAVSSGWTWPSPFGMVMIEALACGTPVVATPNGSVPALIDHGVTGYVADTEAELAEALGRVHGLDRAACRKAAAEQFSSERVVADHVALYRRLIGSLPSVRAITTVQAPIVAPRFWATETVGGNAARWLMLGVL